MNAALIVGLSCLLTGFALGLLLRTGLARAEQRARGQQEPDEQQREEGPR